MASGTEHDGHRWREAPKPMQNSPFLLSVAAGAPAEPSVRCAAAYPDIPPGRAFPADCARDRLND